MVHVPTRGGVPVRLGPGVPITPGYGASTMSRQPYTDPMQFELEREKVLGTTWLLAARSSQVAGPGDWISFESHGETVVITRQPDGGLAAFHNVCRHRGPSFVTEWQGCGARKFTCPYHGWMYDTTGKVIGVPEKVDFDEEQLRDLRAKPVAVDEWGGWVWVNLAGPDAAMPLSRVDRRGHHARPRPVQDGGHGPARGARVGRPGQLQGDRRRLQRDLPHGLAAPRRPGVDEVGQGHHLPRRQRPQLHVLRPAAAVPRAAGRGLGPPALRHLPLRRVPEHGVQLQPRAHPGLQPDPDRRRPHPLPLLAARLPRRRRRSRVRGLPGADAASTGST